MVLEAKGAQKVNYEFEAWFETIRDLQGDCLIFSTEGTSIRWIEMNEAMQGTPCGKKSNQISWGQRRN